MGNQSTLFQILAYVKENSRQSANQISQATGLNLLTVHRQLNGGYKQISAGTFIREKSTRALPANKDGRVRGSYCWLYSVNPNISKNVALKTLPTTSKKKEIQRDPITAALFGAI